MSVLEEILASTRAELEQRRARVPLEELETQPPPRSEPWDSERRLTGALRRPGLSIIAEHKRRSPSAGAIRPGSSVSEIAAAYERGGASAMSVLTEERHFDGSLEDLRAARAGCDLPLLRKDFIVDRYQLHEARAAGADAILLIVAALTPAELAALRAEAAVLGLDALVEVHDEQELEIALGAGAELLGINNRDLRDFSVEVERTFSLLPLIPASVTVVSESGIDTPEQLARLAAAGVHGALIGEALMRAPDPEAALRELLA